jgi:hypothetical protein
VLVRVLVLRYVGSVGYLVLVLSVGVELFEWCWYLDVGYLVLLFVLVLKLVMRC